MQIFRIILLAFFFPFTLFGQSTVVVQDPVYQNEEVIAFTSSEKSLYFMTPGSWVIKPFAAYRGAWVEEVHHDRYDLRLVLTPSFERSIPWMRERQRFEPQSLFFPLPLHISEAILFLPPELGEVRATLVPDESMPYLGGAYYRLSLNSQQLDIFRKLSQGNLTLQGVLTYEFAYAWGFQETASPITIQLRLQDLTLEEMDVDPLVWLKDLLLSYDLYLQGVSDGSYSLGGAVQVRLRNSLIHGWINSGSFELVRHSESQVKLRPLSTTNFTGSFRVEIVPLGVPVELTFDAALNLTLDILHIEVKVDSFEISNVRLAGGGSSFYLDFLEKQILDRNMRAKIAEALTSELQARILNQTLFGVF